MQNFRRVVQIALAVCALAPASCKHATSAATLPAVSAGAGRELPPSALPADPTAAATAADAPKGVNLADLDATERRVFVEVLDEQFDPCGKARSFRQGLDAGDCPIARKLARSVVELLRQGQSKKQTVGLLLREIERLNTVVQIDVTGAPRKGDAAANVTVVEFSDFECPYCRVAAPRLEKLRAHYGFVLYYRYYPLQHAHPNAVGAARAAWAAHQQGKFWELHDLLFANAHALEWPAVQAYAKQVGLDAKRFQADVEGDAAAAGVASDMKAGETAGVDGTPTFFVNGRKAETLPQVQDLVRDAMAAAGVSVPAPLGPADLGEAAEGAVAPTPTVASVPASGAPPVAPPAAPLAPVLR
ncbi:MAG: hypothetical protein EXR79_00675 [Myxococcales bacterium]|nr:hypothetical protein [Myxococcales bacterium]